MLCPKKLKIDNSFYTFLYLMICGTYYIWDNRHILMKEKWKNLMPFFWSLQKLCGSVSKAKSWKKILEICCVINFNYIIRICPKIFAHPRISERCDQCHSRNPHQLKTYQIKWMRKKEYFLTQFPRQLFFFNLKIVENFE